nr:unnamed protein product [Callosobruchus chinensis]
MKFSGSWKRARCLVTTAWAFSVLFSVPILILYEEKVVQGQLQCWLEFSAQWQWRLYMTLVCISLFALPTAIIATCYAIIIITIWTKGTATSFLTPQNDKRSKRERKENSSDNLRRASSRGLIPRAKVKTVKITLVIVSVFVICWSPYMIFDLLQVYGQVPPTQTNIAIATLVQSLAPLNSAANPLIYAIFSTNCGCCHRSNGYARKEKSERIIRPPTLKAPQCPSS